MHEVSAERFPRAQTIIASLLTLAALALLGFVLAYWTWAWFAPPAEPRIGAAAEPTTQVIFAKTVFGEAPRGQTAKPTAASITLLGLVAAASGRRGHAIVRLDTKEARVAREDDEIAPGIRLAEIHRDHIVLEMNGMRETLAWPKKTPAAQSAQARSAK